MRRILQGMGAEVIHLGHNRSVEEIVTAALQEDVQGIAGQQLPGRARRVLQVHDRPAARARRRAHPGLRRRRRRDRAGRDHASCTTTAWRASSRPRTASSMGLAGHDRRDGRCAATWTSPRTRPKAIDALQRPRPTRRWRALAQAITALENGQRRRRLRRGRCARRPTAPRCRCSASPAPAAPARVSLTDELIRRLRLDQDDALSHRGDLASTPVAAQERRRAAGRPHPHERDQPVAAGAARLHALAWPRATPAARSARRCPT
ncbi:MAG: hypothetical protein MZW92_36725 [Comamonadaceae bacterium]|nr:hypothetical protein [Comamonadaceae bacterium]